MDVHTLAVEWTETSRHWLVGVPVRVVGDFVDLGEATGEVQSVAHPRGRVHAVVGD